MTHIDLPYTSPPLSLNDRLHWAAKARLVATVRTATHALARTAKVQHVERATVTLHYRQRARRAIDKDNLFATLKPCIDGLRDAGVLDEDDSTRVEPRVEIHAPIKGQGGALWLTVEPL